jgi:gliding motility-associated-like protein
LNGSGGTTYTWTGPGGYLSNIQNPVIASAQNTNAGTYTLTVTNVSGCTNFTTVTVVVNPLPVIVVNNPLACVNQTINLTASGGTAYAWSGPLGYTSNLQSPSIPNAQLNMSGGYTVVVTSAQGCTASAVANATVITLPQPTITSNSPLCAGATLSLTGGGGSGYSWSGPGGFTSNLQNPLISNAQPVNSGIYTLVVTAGTCSNSTTSSITVNPLPTPTVSSSGTVCQLQPINLGAAGGTAYAWTGPNGYSANTASPVISVAQNTNAGTYTVLVTGANGCNNTATTSVVVNPLPSPVTNSPIACLNQPINLTSGGGVSYSWTGPNGFTSIVQNPVIANAQFSMSGLYTVVVTSAQNCTASAVASVSVISLPQPSITSNTPCVGATLSFTGSGGVTYSWTGPNGFVSSLQNPSVGNAQLVNSGMYTLVVTAGTCSNLTIYSATVLPLPTPTVSSSGTVCLLQPINLGASGGTAYAWTGPNGYSANTASPVISVAQNTNAGTYTALVTGANGCNNTAITSIVVNPLPSPATNSPVVCLNQPINLTSNGGVSYSWTGPNGFASVAQNPVIANAQFSMSGLYTVVATSAQGCTNNAVASVTVLSLPQPSITSNIPCVGASLVFNGSGGMSYSWSGPVGFISSLQNPNIGNVQMVNGGTYTLVVTAGTCSSGTTYVATINPLPVPTASVTNPVCVNQQASFTGGGGVNYTWTGPGGFNQPSQNAMIASAQFTNGGTYTLTVSDANSCVNYTTTNLTVNPLPQINVNNPSVCQSGVINLAANGAVSYTWSGPQGFTSNSSNPGIPFAQPNQSGPYMVIGASAQGCTNTAVANVQVIPSPSPVIASNAPVCVNGMLSISASGGNSYQWYGPNNFSTTATGTNFPNVQLSIAGVYTLIATVGTCTGITTSNIIVNPLPTPTLSSNAPVCENSMLLLSGPGGYSYQWSGPNSFSGSGSNISITNAFMSNAGTFTAIATDQYGCVGSATISVNINPLPLIGTKGSTLCANTTITLSASGGTGYSWTGPQGFTSGNATVNIQNSTTDMAGDYTVTVTDVNNCSRSAVVNVSINPVPQVTIGSNGPICAGQTLSLTAQAQNVVLYYWHGPLNWLSVEQNPPIVGLQPNASGVYSVHVHDQIGCTGTATLDVLVRNLPQLNITRNKYSGCVPLCINLGQQSSSQIVSGAWQFGEGGNSYGLTASYCYNEAGHYVITNNYTDNFGCANASTVAVDAWPIPVADFNVSPDKPVTNESIDFTDATYNAIAAEWTWYFSDESSKIHTGKNINRSFTDAGEYAAVLIVTSDHGCRDTIVKPILVGEDFGLYVPDAFTPNGDGLNDIFTAKGIGIAKFNMNIFDRWGELLYSTNSMENGWDGKFHSRGDEIVKQDVYVWKIKATDLQGKVHELAGTVTLMK